MGKINSMTVKTKNVNAYVKDNGKIVFVITLENGDTTFINGGLISYAGNNARPVKSKQQNVEEN